MSKSILKPSFLMTFQSIRFGHTLLAFTICQSANLAAIETSIATTGDTWLRGIGGANNDNKAAAEVLIGNINASTVGRGILEFDLSTYSLAAGDSITAARIELVVSSKDGNTTNNPGTLNLDLRLVDDGGQIADLTNGTNWNDRSISGPTAWTTAGGNYGTSLLGTIGANPFSIASNDVVSLPITDLSGITLGGTLQFGLLCPDAEALGGTRALFRFHSLQNSVGSSVVPQLILETSLALVGGPPSGDLNVSGLSTITTNTTVSNVLLGSGADGNLTINGGTLTVTGDFNSGNSAAYRDGVLEQINGSVTVAGDLDFSANALSASVLRLWNPGRNTPISTAGHLDLGRVVLTMEFDSSYTHSPGTPHTLLTYASRTGRFENVPADGIVSHGVNRFRIDYDVSSDGAFAITATALENYTRPANQPNLIFIMVDDQGYGELTPYGAPAGRTPALGTLASQGLFCTSGYAVASVCSPTRGGLLTGRHCESVGHRQNIGGGKEGQGLSPVFRTHMERLASVGYHNYWIGKWYAGSSAEKLPLQRGVERFFTISDGLSHTAGTDQLQENGLSLGPSTQYLTDHMGDKVVEYIADHLANHPGDPFHIHWSDYAPHSPFNADPADLQTLFGVKGSYATWEKIAAMNLAIDRNVQKLMDFLDDPDGDPETDDSIADNTLIVYTNDNGGTGSHNNGILRGSKGFQYEGGIRVPMIARWPGRITPANFDQPAHQNDWIATFCALAGVPGHERSELDGLNLMPILDGDEPYPVERELFWNLWPRWIDDGEVAGGMRKGVWKLMVSEDLAVTELYNLDTDPGESNNVKAINPAIHDAMFASYRKWQRTNVTPQWQESFNPNIITRDSGLYLRALHNGYRLTNRNSGPLYYTTETRPFFNLTSDFELTVTMRPRAADDLNASSKAWVVFGFSSTSPLTNVTAPPAPPWRSGLCRVGIDFGSSALIADDLYTSTTAASVAMPGTWVPKEGATIAIQYSAATRTMSISSEGASTTLTLPAGINEWQNAGFGVEASEIEFTILRDSSSPTALRSSQSGFENGLFTFTVSSDSPNGIPLRIEESEDLQAFSPSQGAFIEYLSPGNFRVKTSDTGDKVQMFYRAVSP